MLPILPRARVAAFVEQDVVLFVRGRAADAWWLTPWAAPARAGAANIPSVDNPPPYRRDLPRGWWEATQAAQRPAAIASLIVVIAPTAYVPAGRPVNLYTLLQAWKEQPLPVTLGNLYGEGEPLPAPPPFAPGPRTTDTPGLGGVWGRLGRNLAGKTVTMRATSWATGEVRTYAATVMQAEIGIVRAPWAGRSPAADGWRIDWIVRG